MKRFLYGVCVTSSLVIAVILLFSGRARPIGAENNQPGKFQVKIDNFSFTPRILTVPAGATVTWVNQDDVPHTVVSSEGKTLKSPVLDTDDKYSFTFAKAGSYPYYCSIHPRMVAKVVVR